MSKYWNRKGAQALFLLLGILVSTWASGASEAAVWHWALALALLAGALQSAGSEYRTWLGAAVATFVFWTIFHTLFVSGDYSPAGIFHPLFLLAGFALGRRAWDGSDVRIGPAAAGLAIVAIVCYALFKSGYAGTLAAAPFETPAVLAALINLALLPAATYLLWDSRPTPARFVACAIFFAGLIAAASRGGWIGLLVGLAFVLVVHRGRLPAARNAAVLAASVCLAWGLVVLIRFARTLLLPETSAFVERQWAGLPALALAPTLLQADSSVSRLELYAEALHATGQHFPLGAGYLSFVHVLEAGRERVPSYGSENLTYFVHNDYLQTLLELGLPGACALLALVLIPLGLLLRYRNRLQPADLLACSACAGGLAAMAFQASVDFPFYVPVCLALFGFLLGILDARLAGAGIGVFEGRLYTGSLKRAGNFVRRVGFAIGLVLLLVPIAAEWSSAHGKTQWREGRGEEAAYGFELARRLQPADWRYAWYAGKFWAAQAAATRNPKAATLADASFARGAAANRLEVKNLLGRIELHMAMPRLLVQPASADELEAWSAEALALAPRSPRVRTQRVLVLERAGKIDAARKEAAMLALDEPADFAARALVERLSPGVHQ